MAKETKPRLTWSERKPFFLFRKKRSGVVLTRGQIKDIKRKRKHLRREMRAKGIKKREDIEVIASGQNLYFDRGGKLAAFKFAMKSKGGLLLLGAAVVLLLALWLVSWITTMRGHFTINMSHDLFSEGFSLSETADFENPTSQLMCDPLNHVPEISISSISADVIKTDGQHNSNYFAYTYYIRNEGSSTADYKWELVLNSESQNVSSAIWVMVFEDDKMVFYAKENEDGDPESLPGKRETGRGYVDPPLYNMARYPREQYEKVGSLWRVIPRKFESDTVAAHGVREQMKPGETHKYTIVMWLEGDDPDCNDELVGGHLGMEIYMSLLDKADDSSVSSEWKDTWEDFWNKIFG